MVLTMAVFFLTPVISMSCMRRPEGIVPSEFISRRNGIKIPEDWEVLYINDGYPSQNCSCNTLVFPPYYCVFNAEDYDDDFLIGFSAEKNAVFEWSFMFNVNSMAENGEQVPEYFRPDFTENYLWQHIGENEQILYMVFDPKYKLLYALDTGI